MDSRTNEPIVGAVISADWLTSGTAIQPGHASFSFEAFHRAEGKTSTDGSFVLPGWGPELRPFYEQMSQFSPRLRVFKTGYYPRLVFNRHNFNPDALLVTSEWNGKDY